MAAHITDFTSGSPSSDPGFRSLFMKILMIGDNAYCCEPPGYHPYTTMTFARGDIFKCGALSSLSLTGNIVISFMCEAFLNPIILTTS